MRPWCLFPRARAWASRTFALPSMQPSTLSWPMPHPARAPRSGPALPIDRCFTIKGSGTVVTGTLHDAPVAVGDELVSCPAGVRCRVRAIQVHGDTPRALPGQRAALNIVGDGAGDLPRGEVLCGSGAEGSTLRLIARFTYLARGHQARALRVRYARACDGGHGGGPRSNHAHGG